jgi:uncharacterized tellurite resistance protein B-like protein
MSSENYQLGLLYLAHLLISADGVINENELLLLQRIRKEAQISDSLFTRFEHELRVQPEREIYRQGIELINNCTDEEKLDAFAQLYRLSDADGSVHVKEVRLLLYAVRASRIDFNDVVARAKGKQSQ